MSLPSKFFGNFAHNFNYGYLSKGSYIHHSTTVPFESTTYHNNSISWDINYILKHRDGKRYDVYVDKSIVLAYKEMFREGLDFPSTSFKLFEVLIQKIVMSYIKSTFLQV